MGLFEIAVTLAVLAICVMGWLMFGMFAQIGRLLLRVEDLEQARGGGAEQRTGPDLVPASVADAPPRPGTPVPLAEQATATVAPDTAGTPETGPQSPAHAPGFPPGTVLFEFELPDLDGRQTLRSSFNGRALLLVFISPACPHSRALLVDLAALRAHAPASWPLPVLVSTGPREENMRLMEEAGVQETVLLQNETEVADLLRVPATPMAYAVDEEGKTASFLVAGRTAILGVAASSRRHDERYLPAAPAAPDQLRWLTTGSLTTAGSFEHGLALGTVAPAFELPRTDGGTLTLDSYRGRRVLLVFVDAATAPSDALAARLAARPGTAKHPEIVLIGRGDLDANRAWAARHGLTPPVVVQARWQVSRAYRLLAAPVAYLVDEQGTIAEHVAVGVDAVLDLVRRSA